MTSGSTHRHPARPLAADTDLVIPGASVVLGYDGLRVRVAASDRAHLEWLEEFLGPSFENVADAGADCLVALAEDSVAYRDTLARGRAADGGHVDTFALDRRLLSFPRWAGPATTVWHEEAGLFYRVAEGRRTFVVLAEPGNLAARVGLMRAVRELAMGHAGQEGLLLHASAAAVAERVVVLAGPTAAGKTTLLLHLLRSGGASYLANDRVRVSFGHAAPRARGIPTIVTIRPRTLELFPDLAERLRERAYQARRGLREPVPGPRPPGQPLRHGRIGLSPAQLAEGLGVARVAEGEVAAVVCPTITGAAEGLSVRPMSPAEAVDRLAESLLGPEPWRNRSFFRPPGARPAPDLDALRARCRRLAEAVPCFECRLGDAAYLDPTSAARVLGLAR